MVEITALEFTLDCDAENAMKSVANLQNRGVPDLLEGVEDFAVAFEQVSNGWGKAAGYSAHHREVQEYLERSGPSGMNPAEAFHNLGKATLLGRDTDGAGKAQDSLLVATTIVARAQLSTRVRRDFLLGMGDLLRLRVTSATGYVRLQCETAALLRLMHKDPLVARDWFDGLTDEGGVQFYRAHGKAIGDEVEALGLDDYHLRGSNTAMHSRIGGIARGLLLGDKVRKSGEVKLAFQEVDHPALLLFELVRYLRFHRDLLERIDQVYPDLAPEALAAIDRAKCYAFFDRVLRAAQEAHQKLGKEAILIAIGWKGALR